MSPFRHVFFIGGFDPKSPAHFHRLYRTAAQQHPSSPAGEQVVVEQRQQKDAHLRHWDVRWQTPDGQATHTRYGVWAWDDIVRKHWTRNVPRVMRDYAQLYGISGLDGSLRQLYGANPPSFWLAMLPLGVCLASLLLAMGLGAALGWLFGQQVLACALAGLMPGVLLWRAAERRLDGEWMLRLYGFTHAQARGQIPDLEERIDQFAEQLVATASQTEAAELMVVGHSAGTILAVSGVARALTLAPWLGTRGPELSLLTLGHSTPALGFQLPAQRFRDELQQVANHPPLSWVDYSAPADWAACSRRPPWLFGEAVGLKQQLSPRFHEIVSKQTYAALRKDRHRMHMQYLKAPEVAGGYDPVTLTASPFTLAQAHGGAAPAARVAAAPPSSVLAP